MEPGGHPVCDDFWALPLPGGWRLETKLLRILYQDCQEVRPPFPWPRPASVQKAELGTAAYRPLIVRSDREVRSYQYMG